MWRAVADPRAPRGMVRLTTPRWWYQDERGKAQWIELSADDGRFPSDISPGQQGELWCEMTAPTRPGDYTVTVGLDWRGTGQGMEAVGPAALRITVMDMAPGEAAARQSFAPLTWGR